MSKDPQEILIAIDNKGNMQTEFAGFKGNVCIEEAQKIVEELAKLGVIVDLENITRSDDPSVPEISQSPQKRKLVIK